MRDNYDFSDAIKNPFAGNFKNKYNVLVTYDLTPEDDQGTKDCEPSQDTLEAFEEYLKKAQ